MLEAIEHDKRCLPPLKKIESLLPLLLQIGDSLLPITDLLTDKEIVLRLMRPSTRRKEPLSCGIYRRDRLLSLS
jgi:hypothetical protein